MESREFVKIIWIMWYQGFDHAPAIVQKCVQTWEKHHPDWQINKLSAQNVSDYIDVEELLPGYKEKNIHIEALCNVIRVGLLSKYGGVWADSTLYCNRSLNTWLPEYISNSGFFAFAKPGPDRMMSNWFLASYPGNYIAAKCLEGCQKYWLGRHERDQYFWFHYMFADIYQNDIKFKECWDLTPELSADAPHSFLSYDDTFFIPLTHRIKKFIDKTDIPLFKLTHKYNKEAAKEDSVVYYLINGKIKRSFIDKIKYFIKDQTNTKDQQKVF